MILNLQQLANYDVTTILFSTSINETVTQYKIVYATGVEPYTESYRISYTSYNTVAMTTEYRIAYTSLFGDAVQGYRIRYTSGRDPGEYVDRYYVRYSAIYTDNAYSIYSIRYTTTGTVTNAERFRYQIKYTSESLGEYTKTFKLKYTLQKFYDNSTKYTIRYGSVGAEELLTRAVLIRNNNRTDALFEIKGITDRSLDNFLFVLSNMPKYQTVEFKVGDDLPYLEYIETADLSSLYIFDEEDLNGYDVRGYILLRDIEDLNGLSLDIYDADNDYKKINRSKTYFFKIEASDYISTLLSVAGTQYYFINRSSDYYNALYLNYVSAQTSPTFSIWRTSARL
jgi:hypothetical protein